MTYYAHPTAVIDDGAVIGEDSKIWHFTHVSPTSIIGSRCSLGQNVYIGNHVTIGSGVKIQNNVSVYEGVVLEDDVFCGPSMVFTNVLTPRSAFPRNTREDYRRTIVRRGASIGANATLVCGVTIGQWALIAAGAVVHRDVPPYSLYAGVPARRIGWVCQCGVTLHFAGGSSACTACGREYELNLDIVHLTKEV